MDAIYRSSCQIPISFSGSINIPRGVKKVSRHFEPVKNGILIAPVINISAEIADQSAAIQSSQSFAPAPGMHRLTGDFADDGFIHGTSR